MEYTKGNAWDQIKWLIAQRCAVVNIYRDIAGYLAAFWNDNGCSRLELFEYEQFYHVRQTIAPETLFKEELNTHENELLKAYKSFYALEDEEQATEIMQLYTDLKEYSIAEYWHGVASDLHDKSSKGYEIVLKSCIDDIVIHKNTSAKLYGVFAGREDIYAREVLDAHRGRKIETELKPLTEAVFRDHLSGKITADAYIQRPNATVRYMIIDVDLSKKILLQYERGCDVYNRYMQKVLDYTCMLKKSLMNMGITGYIEYSGNRGYHLWVFFSEWIPVRYINILSDIIDVSNERDEDIAIEYFPNKTRIKGGKYGQAIKLPYGIHVKTGERSYFLNDAGEAVKDPDLFVDSIVLASVADIKRIIAANSKLNDNMIHKEVDNDISVMGDVGDNVKAVLINCPLMRYICLKSVKTSYLTHQERLMVLYVFGHLGDDGNEFIHKVMSFTLNYKYDVTDHFIRKRPDKPISCIKLRDQYKQLTAEFGCNCNFKRNKNCYPSPVLHAISSSPDAQGEVTLPLSRTITKDKEDKVKNEMNVYNKTQEIASKLQDFKKQMRGINKMISKLEHELESIFDDQGVDELEIEMGVLCRRKTDKGVEWFVEI